MDLACSWNIDLTGWLRYFFKSWGVRSATTLWPAFWAFVENLDLFGLKSGLGGDADMAKVYYSRHCPAAHGSWKKIKITWIECERDFTFPILHIQKLLQMLNHRFTVLKFHDFPITWNLREIIFGDFRSAKSAILTHLEALTFDFVNFCTGWNLQNQQNVETYYCNKWQF